MGARANPVAIGAFVVGAVALAVAGVIVFGSGKFVRDARPFVCFFTGDVNGLAVGAPVLFKGVRVGNVTGIRVRLDDRRATLTPDLVARGVRIPVFIEIDPQLVDPDGSGADLDREAILRLIDLGLRAQLVVQSFVTGLLAVQLDFYPDTAVAYMTGPDASPQEIPTIPTQLERMQSAAQEVVRQIERLEIPRLVGAATGAAESARALLDTPGLRQALAALPDTVSSANDTIRTVRDAATRLERAVDPLARQLDATAGVTAATLDQARTTLARLDQMVDPGAPLVIELLAAIGEFRDAARAVRLLADSLERNPSALIRGRPDTEPAATGPR